MFETIPSDFDVNNPQFSITCVSSGGPVGCVMWKIYDYTIINPNTSSTLINAVDGRYVHKLTVIEHEFGGGLYSCLLFNNKPESTSENTRIHGKLLFRLRMSIIHSIPFHTLFTTVHDFVF